MKKTLCLLLTLAFICFTIASAEESALIRQRVVDDAPGVTLFSGGELRDVCLSADNSLTVLLSDDTPAFLCFPIREGASMQNFGNTFARCYSEDDHIQFHYNCMRYPDEDVLQENRDNVPEEQRAVDWPDAIGVWMPEENYGTILMAATPMGKDMFLWINTEFVGLGPEVSEAERTEIMTAAMRDEVSRLRGEMRAVSATPYWNADLYSGVELIDENRQRKLRVEFPALTKRADGAPRQGGVILDSLFKDELTCFYRFDADHFIMVTVSLKPGKDSYAMSKLQAGDGQARRVTLGNGSEWIVSGLSTDTAETNFWSAAREVPGVAVDGEPLYVNLQMAKRYRDATVEAWKDEAACMEDLALFDEHLRVVDIADDEQEPTAEPGDGSAGAVQADGGGEVWLCPTCGNENAGNFCTECGTPKPLVEAWLCPQCGSENTGKFCPECGAPKPVSRAWLCPNCNSENTGNFCTECGAPRP